MKKFKKILALALAAVMVLAMSITVSAAGDGSITVKNATKGYKYEAYKILDATYTTVADDPATTDVDESKTPLVSYTTKNPTLFGADGSPWKVATIADANGNYNVQLASGKTADEVNAWIKTNLSSFTAIAPTEGADANGLAEDAQVKWTGLDYGYYYITSGLGANVTVDSTTPNAEVYDKNETEPVDPTKTIIEIDGVAKDKITKATAHVGSVVKFQIEAKTNNWIDQDHIRTEWEVTDTPTNMTIDLNSVEVKVNGTKLTSGYTATLTDGVLKVNIPMVDSNGNSIYAANTLDANNTILGLIPIEITYKATIDATAASASAKNQLPGDNPPPPVVINTYAFQVAKVDGDDQPLKGAQFELWSAKGTTGDAAKLTFIDNKDGTYTYSATGTVTTLDMTTNTTIVVKGLDTAWNYTLKEITVPAGYNQAEDKDIAGSSLTEVSTTVVNVDGTTTTTEIDTTPTSTVLYKETIKNQKGVELPSTGGMGTTILYIVGGVVVAAALVLLITKRRMRREDY
ncbi:MAG: LPXTG cell wall anchor domain-containing protein [Eubacterium sp.]|nr:LPXTG cell wall anchor domain-containing protein [Eubacterium sp.]